ncbi:MAG: MMPL family transporter [Oscillospiraceae bacterium]|jgi:predicted RND superfamily exporter protein|nr:MMPL family transporter [Oscillospiraceae bacterium]
MERFAGAIIRHRRPVLALFLIAAAVFAVLFLAVKVNYNMSEYLPDDAQSTEAIGILGEEFSGAMPNASVSLRGVSLTQALRFKQTLLDLEHVDEALWLDDITDLAVPLEMGDKAAIEAYYKNGDAFYQIVIPKGYEKEGVREVRALLGDRGGITGEAAEIEYVQAATGTEVRNAIVILVPIILLILILTTNSWIEPLLFVAAIGVSVAINMGTNAFAGSVSFLTNAVTPILQLAVSLDYAIFLLHSFGAHRKAGDSVEDAMRKAVKESFATVAASASTTLFGFMALMFMDFSLGADLGLSLAKGIFFSFVSVMVFLPALTMCVYKAIDRTRHRDLIPTFSGVYKVLKYLAVPAVLIVLVIVVPSFLGQTRTDFVYGYQLSYDQMTGEDAERSTVMVLLVPKGELQKEEALSNELLALPHVTSVTNYTKTVGAGIPPGFLSESITNQFYSERYARMVINTDTASEGPDAFRTVEEVTAAAKRLYPEGVFTVGPSANLYDIRTVVQKDNNRTNLIAVISIFAVLAVTFRSASLPFFLLLTIEAAIWINLSIPYFTGTPINYIGYLILNTVQLGATVDYAILLTVTYTRNRKTMPKKEAAHKALGSSFRSILVSGMTLATAGFTLAGTSTNPLISDIGILLGRGTLLSMALVLVFLPGLLTIFDKLIGQTTYKAKFLHEPKPDKEEPSSET